MTFSKTFVALAAGTLLVGVSPVLAQQRAGGQNRSAGRGDRQGTARDSARQPSAAPRADSSRQRGAGSRSGPYGSARSAGPARSYSYGSPRSYNYGSSRGYSYNSRRFYQPYYTFRPRVSLGFGLWVGFPTAYPYYYDDPYYSPYGYPDPYGYPYPSTSYPGYPASRYPQYPPQYPSNYPPQYPSNYPSQYPSNYPPQNPSSYPSQYPSNYPSQYPSNYPPQTPSASPQYPSAQGSVGVRPGRSSATTGGVSFEITPDTAQVFVDGSYVGTVAEFTPSTQPLDLTPGRHRIEVRAIGYRTFNFDADVVAGQVLPFQGAMER